LFEKPKLGIFKPSIGCVAHQEKKPNMNLDGMRILVTGTSKGIGLAIAEELLKRNAFVGMHYRQYNDDLEALTKAYPAQVSHHNGDLSNGHSVAHQLVQEFVAQWSGLDAIILNAGIAQSSPLDMDSEEWETQWDQTMAVNLKAPALLAKAALPVFQKQKAGGRLIFISSRAAFRGDTPAYWAYAASKGGLISLAKSIAKDFGKEGIKAFTVSPGFVQTKMAQQFIDQYGEDFVKQDLALNTLTQPSDVAQVVAFLASGLGDHTTGTNIDVNAGSYLH
jgi:3-oxoacyl-[acyl-carrier protein] reductase